MIFSVVCRNRNRFVLTAESGAKHSADFQAYSFLQKFPLHNTFYTVRHKWIHLKYWVVRSGVHLIRSSQCQAYRQKAPTSGLIYEEIASGVFYVCFSFFFADNWHKKAPFFPMFLFLCCFSLADIFPSFFCWCLIVSPKVCVLGVLTKPTTHSRHEKCTPILEWTKDINPRSDFQWGWFNSGLPLTSAALSSHEHWSFQSPARLGRFWLIAKVLRLFKSRRQNLQI